MFYFVSKLIPPGTLRNFTKQWKKLAESWIHSEGAKKRILECATATTTATTAATAMRLAVRFNFYKLYVSLCWSWKNFHDNETFYEKILLYDSINREIFNFIFITFKYPDDKKKVKHWRAYLNLYLPFLLWCLYTYVCTTEKVIIKIKGISECYKL